MLLDVHTHLDGYDDTVLDAALVEITTQRILTVAVAMDPPSYAGWRPARPHHRL
jgi:hypothetical protein